MGSACTEPSQVYAGDTAQWKIGPNESVESGSGLPFGQSLTGKTMGDYSPSDGWLLHYVAKNADQSFTFDATGVDDDFVVSVDTSAMAAGDYLLVGYVDKGDDTERHVVRTRRFKILPNITSTDPMEIRSVARQIYEKIKADETRGVFVAEYTVGSRHCRYNSPESRLSALQFWGRAVAREEGKEPSFYGASFSQ